MTEDEYLLSVVQKYKVEDGIDSSTQLYVINPLVSFIKGWAGEYLNAIYLSGSRAKGTAIILSSDIDLFISLKSDTSGTLEDIYNALYDEVTKQGVTARKQNVSIGIDYQGHSIDLVPAKKRLGNTNFHSLYRNRAGTWTQTNVATHINLVKDSGRITEIVALKIWRKLHGLEFPSIYLELTVLKALAYKNKNQPAKNFCTVLEYLRDEFVDKVVIDPSNSNNTISDDIYKYEKQAIASKAKENINQYWENVIW
jgi:hypothetical protein